MWLVAVLIKYSSFNESSEISDHYEDYKDKSYICLL